ncbi:tyrosine-type recombinase/integrase [Amycolatopsis roodepoortensis]|uniref:tyrosine-type recombinase/integrase n=1 Tax=Amycolatopsis roodepoortensis TaxID=700274 RepID=UPI0017893951|nr:tyrosine-type recombinase/integrase [Amycolatopsis roodepoortensis]
MATTGSIEGGRQRGSVRRQRDAFQVRVSAGKDPVTGERIVLTESVSIEKPGNERSERTALKEAEKGLALRGETWIFSAQPDFSKPRDPSSLTRRYGRLVGKLGVKTQLKELRHYSATQLLTAGVDLRTVAGRLGHGDGSTTLRHYAAWVGAADKAAAETIGSTMPKLRQCSTPQKRSPDRWREGRARFVRRRLRGLRRAVECTGSGRPRTTFPAPGAELEFRRRMRRRASR